MSVGRHWKNTSVYKKLPMIFIWKVVIQKSLIINPTVDANKIIKSQFLDKKENTWL